MYSALEERLGRIRSAEVHCALWNSTLKRRQGRERGEGRGGGGGGAQVEISGAAQPVFLFTLVSWKHEQKRYTPESRLQSNYFEQ